MRRTRITEVDKQLARNLKLAMGLRGFTNETLAAAMDRPGDTGRNWVQERTSGRKPVTWGEIAQFSLALEIPTRPLTGKEHHLLRYLSENPDLLINASTWSNGSMVAA